MTQQTLVLILAILVGLCALALLLQVIGQQDRLMPHLFCMESERPRAAFVQVLLEDYQRVLTLALPPAVASGALAP